MIKGTINWIYILSSKWIEVGHSFKKLNIHTNNKDLQHRKSALLYNDTSKRFLLFYPPLTGIVPTVWSYIPLQVHTIVEYNIFFIPYQFYVNTFDDIQIQLFSKNVEEEYATVFNDSLFWWKNTVLSQRKVILIHNRTDWKNGFTY